MGIGLLQHPQVHIIQFFRTIRKGKNIWVEKPICNTLDDTLDIFSKKPDDVFLYCDFTWLQHEAIKRWGFN